MRTTIMNKSLFCIGTALIFLVILSAGSLWAAVPNPVSGLTATALSATQIRLDWTDNSTDETYFYIERKTGAGGTYAYIGNVGANITIYTSANLTQNTEYYYRVRAYNASGYSAYSNEAAATTLTLNAPTNLSVSAVSYTQITIAWTDNSGEETGFSIERKTGAGGTYAPITTTAANATSYTNTGLTQGTEYYYRVRTVSGSNYSQYSDETNATTLTVNAPSSLTATPLSATQIRLNWTDSSTDETNFYIDRKTGAAGAWSQISSVGANVTTYTSTGLTQETTYYYRVRAYNAGNYSAYSNEANATTLTLNAPTGLAVGTVSYTQITITWTDNSSEETGFSIERKTGAGGTYASITTTAANATSYTNTGLIQGTEYYYRMRTVSGSNYSQYSAEANATTLTVNAPSNLTVTPVCATQIRLDWTDNSADETYFYIERKTGAGGTYAYIGNVGANVTTYTSTGLTQETTYYYRVRAYNAGNYSVYSNEASATTSTLNAPTNLSVSAVSYAQVSLTWTDNTSDETGFSIERKTGTGGTYAQVGLVGANVATFTNGGLTQGTEYYYRVRAVSGSNYSQYSDETNVTTLTVNAPSVLTVTPLSSTQIKLDWTDNSTDETNFYIERKTGAGGTYAYLGSVGANVTTYASTGLTQNTTYYYRVRAYNAGNYSVYSNEASATTLTLAAPTGLAIGTVSFAQVTLTWTDNSNDETGFSIERKTGAGGTYAQVATTAANATSHTNTGLTQGTEYYYRVRAVNGANYSEYSNEVNATTLTLNAPSVLTVTPLAATQIKLDWTDNSADETNFYIERKTGAGGTYAYIGNVGANVATYTSTGLTQNTTYYYRVRAYNAGNYSVYSNEASATTPSLAPPSNLSATVLSTSQITLTWTDNTNDEAGFSIERKTGAGGTYALIATTAANATSYTNSGLTQGTEYYYRVRAVSGSNYSQYSNEVNATPILLPPSNLMATPLTYWHIELAWNDNSTEEAVSYIEYRVEGTDIYTTLPSVPANTTTYIHADLTPGATYHYRVRAYNSSGYSTYSNVVSATTPTVKAPPVIQGAADTAGTEFFVAFQPNNGAGSSNLTLFITGQQDTQGVVDIPGLNSTQAFAVQANQITTVSLPAQASVLGSNSIKNLGVRVTALSEITVYGLNQKTYTTDAFLALPVDILGLEYIAMSYSGNGSQVAVVGIYDNTQVTITPSATAAGRSAGVPFSITLNHHDTFQLTGSMTDLTGTIITASAPVAVSSGNECVNVPVGYPWCDHIVEMMPPVTTWGKSFLTVPLATRLKGDVFRILASQDNTAVYLNGVLETTLNRGKFLEKILTARTQIETSAPVLAVQYSPGQSFDNVVSDPFMMLVPPTEQFLNQYSFSTPATGFTRNFVNIVVPTSAISSLNLDGVPVNAALFSSIGSSGYSGAQVPIFLGSHIVTGDVPFGIYVYGFGECDSYGYPGGSAIEVINPLGDAYQPNVRLIQISDTIQGTATDSEDINANGALDSGEDLNGNSTVDRRSEDINSNDVLDPGEDLNGNGYLDRDTGIFKVELAPGSTNLQLNVTPFIPGALTVNYSISLVDPNVIGTGSVRISDGSGNVLETPILLSKFSLLKNVRIIDTISTQGIELDTTSFTKSPYSITTTGDTTAIEWRFDYFPVNLVEDIGFDVILKNPVNGEQRLVSQKLELVYNDPNGNPVRTELGSQYVNVLNSAFDSTVNTDKLAYQANEEVNVSATINNLSEYARIIDVKIVVEDSIGTFVKEITTLSNLNFNAGEVKNFGNLIFNTGLTYAGDYRAHLILSENQKQIGEAFAQFKIQQPTTALSSKVTADKSQYGPNENVTITSLVTSLSSNVVFENLAARVSVISPDGSALAADTRNINTLMPGDSITFKSYWNTGTHAPGNYPVTLEVKDANGALITAGTATITINNTIRPLIALRGTISVDKQSLLSGETLTTSYTVANIGNIDLSNVTLSILTVDLKDHAVYDTLTSQATLSMGATYPGTGQFNTTNYTAKDYLVVLRASINGVEETLAGTYFRVEGAPTAPALIAPAMGSNVDTLTPVLTVSNASDPNDDKLTYEFELYSDSGLSTLVVSSGLISEGTGTTGWTAPFDLTENATYYWRSRAYDGKLYGSWMETASFRVNTANEPPTAPVPTNPIDGSSVSVLTPVLTVTNATDPDSIGLTYNFDIALDPDFIQIVATTKGVFEGTGVTSWQVAVSLQENTTYYWRAQADDWQIEGPWSVTARFFVNTTNEAPAAPVILTPADGSSIAAQATDITVANSADPDSSVLTYFFELDTEPTFSTPSLRQSGGVPEGQQGTTLWNVAGLTDNTWYYVRAKASDGQAESTWSTSRFFVNTTNDPPTTPTLANPSDGAGVTVDTPTLSVYNSMDLDKDVLTYEFEVYNDSTLTSLVTSTTAVGETPQTTAWTVSVSLTENQTYYWRARAFDGQAYSAWMNKASFFVNTANDAPGAPTLYSPLDGATINTFLPTLSVTNAVDPDSDALTYEFEVSNGATVVWSGTGVPQDPSGTTAVSVTTALADNTTYQWKARAFDGDRYGPWMNMATFTVHVQQAGINVEIEVEPETLNQKSHGNWVMVEIELPHGYHASDVDLSSIRLEGVVPAETRPYGRNKHHNDHGCEHDRAKHDHDELKVKFDRNSVIALLPNGDHVPVHLTGRIGSITFEGVDFIRVIH